MHLPTKNKLAAIGAGAVLLGGASYAGSHSLRPDAPLSVAPISGTTTAPSPKPTEAVSPVPSEPKEVVVAMAGAVKIPGLLHLASDARVGDAIKRAGGVQKDADLDRINLAAKLVDGDQVYVPHRKAAIEEKATEVAKVAPRHRGGAMSIHYAPIAPLMPPPLHGALPKREAPISEAPSFPQGGLPPVESPPSGFGEAVDPPLSSPRDGGLTTPEASPSGHGHYSSKVKASEPVSLNSAGEAELETLPGVGPATAQKILAYRQEHGGFHSLEEIMSVKGIGEKKFEKMRPFLKL